MTLYFGLTGSIGMGKTTTSQMFRDEGIRVHDADQMVHDLYAGEAASLIEAAFPGSVVEGVVDRAKLGTHVIGDADAMKRLEAIIHPMVRDRELEFRRLAKMSEDIFAILDIPLLFETGSEDRVDGIIVVTAPPDVQRARVLAREGMTEAKFEAILARQTPDAEKRSRADFIIDTSTGMETARAAVREIIRKVTEGNWSKRIKNDA
ncbi:MAG: dephospho-CoA kinase [Ahrensia sp.]|nr:dephospho-CoA kinase [Ahrensia sp.]